jgi:preprotein translocase subunit SecE
VLNKTTEFLNHVKAELKKVTWPTRKETYASTTVVIVLVLFVTVFLGLSTGCWRLDRQDVSQVGGRGPIWKRNGTEFIPIPGMRIRSSQSRRADSSLGAEEMFGEVLIPSETVVELRKGERKTSAAKIFPRLYPRADGAE